MSSLVDLSAQIEWINSAWSYQQMKLTTEMFLANANLKQ
jgi:hypothetical protein